MPTRKAETYELGAVDSRSNPANFPLNRSIRCLNFAPQSSGGLRLRSGWTNKTPAYGSGPANYTIVQSKTGTVAATGGTIAFDAGAHAKSLLLAVIDTTSVGSVLTGITDDQGNVWTEATSGGSGDTDFLGGCFAVWYAPNAKAGTLTLTLTWTGGGGAQAILHEVSGVGTVSPVDLSIDANNGPLSTQIYAVPETTAQAFDFVFAAMMSSQTATAEIPLTALSNIAFTGAYIYDGWFATQLSGLIGGAAYPYFKLGVGGYGYIRVIGFLSAPVTPTEPVHSLVYYEQFSSSAVGPQFLLVGQDDTTWNYNLATGSASAIVGLPNANPWGHFRSKNRIHVGDGGTFYGTMLNTSGYNFGVVNWDGTNFRPTGIPMFVPGAAAASTVSSTMGSFTPTQLAGYQFYAAWYNPVTQHMGNRTKIGQPVKIGATQTEIVLSGLASPPPNPEWVTAVGMTNDGGQVPYWMVDSNGNHIVVAANFSSATLALGAVDRLSELPVRNDVPGPFDKFARVGTRLFANLSGSPYLYYSNDESDIQNANYVGNPEESWPLDQAEAFPTGELPTSIQSGKLEGWFFSRSNMAIWSSVLQAQGANPWRGPWPGGCAGQRAFVETPYGRYWLSNEKQLCTFMDDGVISVSEEYELALLGKLADATLYQVQLGYILDPENLTDQIVIIGADVSGNPVVVVHDFRLKDERSPFGCGYNYLYTGITPISFAGAGYTPRTNVYDTNGKMRLWCGTKEGLIAQIEDGSNSDNGATYSADHITIINMGQNNAGIDEIEYQGDPKLRVSVLYDYSQSTVTAFQPLSQDAIPDAAFNSATRFGAKMSGDEARWLYTRLQLDAHPADGNFALTDPPFLPMPSYGCVNATVMKLGRERREAR